MKLAAGRKRHVRATSLALVLGALAGTSGADTADPKPPQSVCPAVHESWMAAGQIEGDYLHLYESSSGDAGESALRKRRLPISALTALAPESVNNLQTELLWNAAALLDAASAQFSPAGSQRRLFTAHKEGQAWRTTPLDWPALTTWQQNQLGRSGKEGHGEEAGRLRLDYLRGDRSHEQGSSDSLFFRRNSLLETAAPTVPVLVGAPALSRPEATYQRFAAEHGLRQAMVYLSANNGMVHGVDALTGTEQFAYLPAAVLPRVPVLIDPQTKFVPEQGVDVGTADALVQGQWKTVLAAGMGRAARGLMALNITQPAAFGQDGSVLFEFTEADDAEMGHVSTAPQLARLPSHDEQGSSVHRYFIVTGNGFPEAHDTTERSPVLFLLSLDKEPGAAWREGDNYYKIRLPGGRKTRPNGLQATALLHSAAGMVQRIYLADLQGRIWRVELENKPLSGGQLTPLTAKLLFSANDAQGRPQAVMQHPRIVHAPAGHLLLFKAGFASALSEAVGKTRDRAQPSVYAIYDDGTEKSLNQVRSDLMPLTLAQQPELGGWGLSQATAMQLAKAGGLAHMTSGWLLDLPTTLEKSGGQPDWLQLQGGRLYFSAALKAANGCTQTHLLTLNLQAESDKAATVPLEVGAMGAATATVMLLPGASALPEKPTALPAQHLLIAPADAADGKGTLQVQAGPAQAATESGRRLSWREIINWQELRRAASP